MAHDDLSPNNDPFGPPAISTIVQCLHCGEQYDSCLIEWRIDKDSEGKPQGFWCCPTHGCSGIGFGFDILPIDPNYHDEHGGWVHDADHGAWDELVADEDFEFGDVLEFETVDQERISPTNTPRIVTPDDDIST